MTNVYEGIDCIICCIMSTFGKFLATPLLMQGIAPQGR